MANQIQGTVYQINGSPLSNPIQVSFLTSNIYIRQYQIDLIPEVNAAIVYYPNTTNQLQEQIFLVSESASTLISLANVDGTTQVSTTVLEINKEPQIPGGLNFSFPAQGISIWPVATPIVDGVNSFIEFKNKKYYLLEDEATLVAAANVGGGGGGSQSWDQTLAVNPVAYNKNATIINGYLNVSDGATIFSVLYYNGLIVTAADGQRIMLNNKGISNFSPVLRFDGTAGQSAYLTVKDDGSTYNNQYINMAEDDGTMALQDPPIAFNLNSTPETLTVTKNCIAYCLGGAILLDGNLWKDRVTVTLFVKASTSVSVTGIGTLYGNGNINTNGLYYLTYYAGAQEFFLSHV